MGRVGVGRVGGGCRVAVVACFFFFELCNHFANLACAKGQRESWGVHERRQSRPPPDLVAEFVELPLFFRPSFSQTIRTGLLLCLRDLQFFWM